MFNVTPAKINIIITVLLILASVSITAVFGDNGILELAKEAGEKTNEAVQGDKENIGNMTNYIKSLSWDASKVTPVTTKDGALVPVPKGFVGSGVDGENTIKDGFVIYEGENPVTNENLEQAKTTRNQFVWVPADGVSLEYKQDKETFKVGSWMYDGFDWSEDEDINVRKDSVATYGGFYVGRYEAGIEESIGYKNGDDYNRSETNKNDTSGTPVSKKGRQAWNFVTQPTAETLSKNMYKGNIMSRLIDSYAWDTICTWISNDNGIESILDCSSWGNCFTSEKYRAEGLYAIHDFSGSELEAIAGKYNEDDNEFNISPHIEGDIRKCYELFTGISERNKKNNIYDFAGNMYEWTTEKSMRSHVYDQPGFDGYLAIYRGISFMDNGSVGGKISSLFGEDARVNISFRIVLYI